MRNFINVSKQNFIVSSQQEENPLFKEIKDNYLKSFEDWLSNSGINPYIGRLMQLFRSENKPLTQSEMQQSLGLSKSTVSKNLKVMEGLQLLKISVAPPTEGSFDKFEYELIDNSLFNIVLTFLTRVMESFKKRNKDNKEALEQIKKLDGKSKENKEIKNLTRIIEEETGVFDALSEKFDEILDDLKGVMLNYNSKNENK